MAQKTWRPSLLNSGNYSTPDERILDMTKLDGGLNLWELDYKLYSNQSPETVNMYWKDGALSSRQGQDYLYEAAENNDPYGAFYCGYKRLWANRWICHKGKKIYAVNIETGVHTSIYSGNLTEVAGGTFFVFGDNLYYMNGHEYVKITPQLAASDVVPYIPTVVMNRQPSGIGGDTYEDENRIAAGKKILFTADGTSTQYHTPYTNLDNTAVKAVVNGTTITEGSGLTVNRTTGVITFSSAPAQTTPATPNNVEITVYKTNTDARNSILQCSCVTVYGTDSSLSVVCGGPSAQPNAYFWSGNTAVGLDPAYFPFDYYNFAGNADEYITGFGKQQDMLVIFKERSIGKSKFDTETISGMTYLRLPYTPVNDTVGCNLERSIVLVENNLVFANTEGGVYVLLDTSAAGENNVLRISRNVNGDRLSKGLLKDLQSVSSTSVVAFNDGQRYWLSANGHAYLWDYEIRSYNAKEERLSWFYFENINPVSWFATENEKFYGKADGSLVKMVNVYHDFGEPMMRKYTFATQNFGTYDKLKDVMRVIFAVRSDTDTIMRIKYNTDYEVREDLTPIMAFSWRLVPRNLSHRSLRVVPYAFTAIRKPRCFHVRHFSMTIYNNELYSDMSLVSAQIVYRYSRRDR